jgi:pimeloyl-ACP methyl ester carboxylesterase
VTWSERLMATLDARSSVLATARGDVQVARKGRGHAVLVVHGGPGGFDQGIAWCRHLWEGGCEVIAPSRPGYLRTPLQSGAHPQDQADLYAAILDVLGIERVAVLGFSSGGPSAVHFAARHPERTSALLLDTAILLPFVPPLGPIRRASFESALAVWLSYELVVRYPHLMARFMIGGVTTGLPDADRRAAAEWITNNGARLEDMQQQFASVAPRRFRRAGWINDLSNERYLAPLPFGRVDAATLVAHGANDAVVPDDHARAAVHGISGAEFALVAGGHHLLSLSPNYGHVAKCQLELIHRGAAA